MLRLILGIFLVGFITACGGGGNPSTPQELGPLGDDDSTKSVEQASLNENTQFIKSDFSPYLEKSTDNQWLRIQFSFFPEGTDFDFNAKTVSIPCVFINKALEGASIQLSAPINPECTQPLVISFAGALDVMSVDGVIVPLGTSGYTGLAASFGIEITTDGIRDASDHSLLASSRGKLEDFYLILLERKQEE